MPKLPGNQHRYETVRDLVNEIGATKIAEIGVMKGETAMFLLKNCPQIEAYLLVDPKIHYPFYEAVMKYKTSFFKMKSEQAALLIADKSLDLVFIDGLHDFRNVTLDLNLWLPKVRKGGILCGHDYGQLTVSYRNKIEVTEAVDKFFGAENIDYILDIQGSINKRPEDEHRSVWIYHVK